jgi:hypothetical protein
VALLPFTDSERIFGALLPNACASSALDTPAVLISARNAPAQSEAFRPAFLAPETIEDCWRWESHEHAPA